MGNHINVTLVLMIVFYVTPAVYPSGSEGIIYYDFDRYLPLLTDRKTLLPRLHQSIPRIPILSIFTTIF